MKCPLCSAKAGDAATECPSCGAIFAKLRQRAEREREEKAHAQARLAAPPPSAPHHPWTWRIVSIVVVAAWMIGFGLYYRARIAAVRADAPPRLTPVPDGTVLMVVDPETGSRQPVQVRRAPSAKSPREQSPPPMPSRDSGPPPGVPPHDPDFDD